MHGRCKLGFKSIQCELPKILFGKQTNAYLQCCEASIYGNTDLHISFRYCSKLSRQIKENNFINIKIERKEIYENILKLLKTVFKNILFTNTIQKYSHHIQYHKYTTKYQHKYFLISAVGEKKIATGFIKIEVFSKTSDS